MKDLIQDSQNLELISESDAFILTYRYAPQAIQNKLRIYLHNRELDKVIQLNDFLNRLNELLHNEQKNIGTSFVSRTLLESTPYPGDIVVLRVILTNVLTTTAHLEEIIAEQEKIASKLLEEMNTPTDLLFDAL
jgi:glutamate decarboxylase